MKRPIKRTHAFVPWAEIEGLVRQCQIAFPSENARKKNEWAELIGYSRHVIKYWERSGQAPARAKYAMVGLLAELGPPSTGQFTIPESELMAVAQGLPAGHPLRVRILKHLLATETAP